MKNALILCMVLIGLSGCQDRRPTAVAQGPGITAPPGKTPQSPKGQLQSEVLEKSQLTGKPVDLSQVEPQGLHVTGFEGPTAYSQTDKDLELVWDKGFREIGFKTRRTDLGDGVQLTARDPEGREYQGNLALQTHYMGEKAGAEKLVYGGWFSPQAGSLAGLWKFRVIHQNQELLRQEIEMKPEEFSLTKEGKTGPFDRHGSYEARYGEKLVLTFRAAKPGDERLVIYLMDYSKPFQQPGGRSLTRLTPVLAVEAPVNQGWARSTLVLGRDLAVGTYKVGIGQGAAGIRAFDSMIDIRD